MQANTQIYSFYSFISRWIFSTNHKNIKILFNNFTTLSSFVAIVPPKSLGKISMFSWFMNMTQENTTMLIVKTWVLSDLFILFVALLGFSWIFIFRRKDTFFVDKVIPHFKKLSLSRKIIFSCFTIFSAIPNKFWINVNIHFTWVILLSLIVYCLGLIFPFVFFCYLIYLVLCFESLIFGLLYEYSTFFQNSINFLLFGNSSEPFASDYFHWFWGNMWKQGLKKAAQVGAPILAGEAKREQENNAKIKYADKQTEQAQQNTAEGFKTPDERAQYHADRRSEWVQENGTVTKAVKSLQDWWG
jgi:hypothetical protein